MCIILLEIYSVYTRLNECNKYNTSITTFQTLRLNPFNDLCRTQHFAIIIAWVNWTCNAAVQFWTLHQSVFRTFRVIKFQTTQKYPLWTRNRGGIFLNGDVPATSMPTFNGFGPKFGQQRDGRVNGLLIHHRARSRRLFFRKVTC